jgi:hypothetical protein
MAKRQLSEAEIEQRRQAGMAGKSHGVYAFRDRGVDALTHDQRSRRAEILETLETPGGADLMLREQAADARMIVELAFAHLREKYTEERTPGRLKYEIWKDPIIARLGTFLAEARRTLTALDEVSQPVKNVSDMLDEAKDAA